MRTTLLIIILLAYGTQQSFTQTSKVQQDYQLALQKYQEDPSDPDNLIWLGRRTAYLGDYQKAIEHYTKGIAQFPEDPRFLRHRGHRYISLREYDQAIADLEKAASMIRGTENQIEPDGMPNAAGIPVSTLHGNIWYHLGLAYYLKHEYDKAFEAYLMCRQSSSNNDNIVSSTHWLYMIQRRMGNIDKAIQMLKPIENDMKIIENHSYYDLCRMYKGLISVDELESEVGEEPSADAQRYGIANWYFYEGKKRKARKLLREITEGKPRASFGYLAAESDIKKYFKENYM